MTNKELFNTHEKPLNKATFINAALELITKDRNETHGEAFDQLVATANLWNTYMDTDIFDAEQVAVCMVLMKISRSCHGKYNPDDFIDMIGYAAIAGEAAATRKQKTGTSIEHE